MVSGSGRWPSLYGRGKFASLSCVNKPVLVNIETEVVKGSLSFTVRKRKKA